MESPNFQATLESTIDGIGIRDGRNHKKLTPHPLRVRRLKLRVHSEILCVDKF